MLCRVYVDVNPVSVELKKQGIGRVPPPIQNIAVGLTNGVRDDFVLYDTAIHKKVLQICLRTREGRQSHPAPKR